MATIVFTFDFIVQTLVDAVSLGALYALLALGIALIFGIMRLVNFAHGELIMVAGYSLVVYSGLPLVVQLALTVATTVLVALAMERVAFRPLRAATPATLLAASFALSYMLQNAAALIFGTRPKTTLVSEWLGGAFDLGSLSLSRLSLVTIVLTALLFAGLRALLTQTRIGVQMRAAAEDFSTARLLGVRADRVIAVAFALSGVLAAVAGTLLVARTGTVTPNIGVGVIIYAFIAVVIGGLGSLSGAVVGGFLLGVVTTLLQAALPADLVPYRDAFVFALALLVLVVRPQGLIPARGSLERRVDADEEASLAPPGNSPIPARLSERAATPVLLITGLATLTLLVTAGGSASLELTVVNSLVTTMAVVGIFVFVGNSGVFSFGHIAFMAVGAYTTAILSMPSGTKDLIVMGMPEFLVNANLPAFPAVLVGALVAGLFALLVSFLLMRLSGLNAALGTFALLLIVYSVAGNLDAVTNGTTGLPSVPKATSVSTALAGVAIAIAVAFWHQQTRSARRLRATREDETAARSLGIVTFRERTVAFVLSAVVVGAAGGLYAQSIGTVQPSTFYLSITFLTVAMLVIGGIASLSGAVVGAVVLSVASELLRRVEEGAHVGPLAIDAPSGVRELGFAALMLLILILRPSGLTGGRELTLRWPRRLRLRSASQPSD